jgi:hypothetical protein
MTAMRKELNAKKSKLVHAQTQLSTLEANRRQAEGVCKDTLTLDSLPDDILSRIVATAASDETEKLFVIAGTSNALFNVAGSSKFAAVNELWSKLMGAVDPAAMLGQDNVRLARCAGSWFKLAHALAARCCRRRMRSAHTLGCNGRAQSQCRCWLAVAVLPELYASRLRCRTLSCGRLRTATR